MKKHEYISEIKNLHLWHKLEYITFINNPAVVFMSMMPLLADCMDTFATKIKNYDQISNESDMLHINCSMSHTVSNIWRVKTHLDLTIPISKPSLFFLPAGSTVYASFCIHCPMIPRHLSDKPVGSETANDNEPFSTDPLITNIGPSLILILVWS